MGELYQSDTSQDDWEGANRKTEEGGGRAEGCEATRRLFEEATIPAQEDEGLGHASEESATEGGQGGVGGERREARRDAFGNGETEQLQTASDRDARPQAPAPAQKPALILPASDGERPAVPPIATFAAGKHGCRGPAIPLEAQPSAQIQSLRDGGSLSLSASIGARDSEQIVLEPKGPDQASQKQKTICSHAGVAMPTSRLAKVGKGNKISKRSELRQEEGKDVGEGGRMDAGRRPVLNGLADRSNQQVVGAVSVSTSLSVLR